MISRFGLLNPTAHQQKDYKQQFTWKYLSTILLSVLSADNVSDAVYDSSTFTS